MALQATDEMLENIGPPLNIGLQQDLGVAVGSELVSERFELLPQCQVVVNLTVEHNVESSLVAGHWLPA